MDQAKQRQQVIRREAKSIEQAAAAVRSELVNVENKTPWWAIAIKWGLIAAAIGGLIYLGSVTGLFSILRLSVAWLRSLLPTPTTHRAKLDAEAIAKGEASGGQREAIAAARTDPTYNAAYKREQKRQRQNPKQPESQS